ncbi:hypothetical protein QM261_18280, partial [Acinetobacter baumannii]|uniref:hypothetical protein n=1 Tax=Acinetobacter baumannii TaxID=470 RepID=UPI0024B6AC4D
AHTVPHRATPCGVLNYQVNPTYTSKSDNSSRELQDDNNNSYIRESDNQMDQDLSNNTRIISSGSYYK